MHDYISIYVYKRIFIDIHILSLCYIWTRTPFFPPEYNIDFDWMELKEATSTQQQQQQRKENQKQSRQITKYFYQWKKRPIESTGECGIRCVQSAPIQWIKLYATNQRAMMIENDTLDSMLFSE